VEAIEIWTDVNGVLSADPRLVSEAFSLSHLRYDELMELSHFGAKVVYPPTVHPARTRNIPLLIKNTFNPDFAGTWIGAGEAESPHAIRGISSIHHVALLRLEGDGMVGVPGIAGRLFGALARRDISVILIGQASSEHSICFAVLPEAVVVAQQEIEREFGLEYQTGLVDALVVEDDLSVIAAVGDQMRHHPGIAGKVFSVLGDRGINIRAIAQGSSELNISLVVAKSDEGEALNAIHRSFFGTMDKAFDVFIMGTGRVGTSLYQQIQAVSASSSQPRTALRVAGLCTSTQMQLDRDRLHTDGALDRKHWEPLDWDRFLASLNEAAGPAILVDCTASDKLAGVYQKCLKRGIPVVSANKKLVASTQEYFDAILQACHEGSTAAYLETTVGAALPVLQTLQSLLACGDQVKSIEGLLSGTAGYLLGQVHEGVPFSDALRKAHELGFTEPDPREDLAGRDVARKLLILARLSGYRMEPDAIDVAPLVPEALLQSASLDLFWQNISSVDDTFAKQARLATVQDERLAFLARFEAGRATVSLESLPAGHPCASVMGTDGFVAFHTHRYSASPLSIRGPGAGPEITASGVLVDILRAAAETGGTATGHLPTTPTETGS
jgi:aspartokinase/homoserine dehydrogenase 1